MLQAQQRFWVGGSGAWGDPAHWAATPDGDGGAGVPRKGDAVVIAPANGEVVVLLDRDAQAADLLVDGSHGTVVLQGAEPRMRINGNLSMTGSVAWQAGGVLEIYPGRPVGQVDVRGIPLQADVRFVGNGTWSLRSDLVLSGQGTLAIQGGTVATNDNMLMAARLSITGKNAKLLAGSSVILLDEAPAGDTAQGAVEPGSSKLIVAGTWTPWPARQGEQDDARAQNVCATGVGQTPFTIDAQLMSNYNGYGVSCHGVCNGQVRVVVAGGVGPFIYNWVGGPATATWNNVCPGNQIVIVTDQGQGVSCATTVQVTDPALLSVIFTGVVPPACAGVCNGSTTAFAVGGVPGYTYSWNNGAGTGSAFNALCPGNNTLRVTDVNNCVFDTTFSYPLQPILPNLTTTDVLCANSCDGTAAVAPAGGTGAFIYSWGPGNPAGNGTPQVTGLCAGNYAVTISDANGCDTTLQFQITEPPPILPNPSQTDASCGGTCDGTASVNPTGGSGTYSYTWAPAPGAGQGTATASGLCEGTYMVTIEDLATGCDTTVAIVIDAPPALVPNPSSTDVTCGNTCDGTATVAPTGGTTPYSYLWSPTPPVGQGNPTASQLCAGTWRVTIRDWANCDTTVEFIIQAPPAFDVQVTQTDETCGGYCDGSASVVVPGGTGPYTFQWGPDNPPGQGTADVTGLCIGLWSVLITDQNGCDTLVQVQINEPDPILLDGSQTDVSCGGVCDGKASVTASGGTPGYTYDWSPAPPTGQGTPIAEALCAGQWTVEVTDANGCSSSLQFDIDEPQAIVANPTHTDASCGGTCDGTASVNPAGGSGSFTFNWVPEPGAGQGTSAATGLCADTYTVTITDAVTGCEEVASITIDAPPVLVPNPSSTDETCGNTCDGTATVAPTGGTTPYSYLWSPAPPVGQGNPTASQLCAGTWSVTIRDWANCDTTVEFVINAAPSLDVQVTQTDETCGGYCDGTASVVVSGGTGPYTFQWGPDNPPGQGTANVTGLCIGLWSVLIADQNGCDTLVQVQINEPDPILLDGSQTDMSCGGGCDATATVIVDGGVPGYTYTWTPEPGGGQGTPTATGLCDGQWNVDVRDANGCEASYGFDILPAPPLDVSVFVNEPSCHGACDGEAGVSVPDDPADYTFHWTPEPPIGQGTDFVEGLCAGSWSVLVTNLAGCDTTLAFVLTEPDAIDPQGVFTDETCNGPCDGTAEVNPVGGAGNYAFLWSPEPPTGQGTASVSGLCAGDWCVTITDDIGCDTTWCFTVQPVDLIQASLAITAGGCHGECNGEVVATVNGGAGGYTFVWSPVPANGQGNPTATGLCEGPGSVTITDAAGCDTTITFNISNAPPIVPNLTVLPEACGASCTGSATVAPTGGDGTFSVLWDPAPAAGQGTANATGLCAGTNYTVTITDGNGCDTTLAFTVPAGVPIQATVNATPPSCFNTCDGAATVDNITGGTPPYTFFWDPAPAAGQGTANVSGLCPGNYTVTIGDLAGCSTDHQFTITAPDPITVAPDITSISCGGDCTGAIVLNTSGGQGGYSYVWSPEPGGGQGTAQVSALCAGDWDVTITDAAGCTRTATFTLDEPQPLTATTDVVQSHCGQCDGSVQLQVSGGLFPYQFQWGAPLNITTSDPSMGNLCGGTYSVLITDAAGCTHALTVVIPDEDGENISATGGSTSCAGVCDGTVSVAFTCSLPPCTVTWMDLAGNVVGTGVNTLTGLCAGSYQVVVANGGGCVAVDTVQVTEPDPWVANISSTPTTCAGDCDGTATIGISGNPGPFNITWTPAPGAGQGTPHATGLCAGAYQIAVQDPTGCTNQYSVLITAPDPITVDATVTVVSCAGSCDGAISLAVTGGNGAFTYSWAPQPAQGQGTASAHGLCPGTYAVTIADANGCDTTLTFTLDDPLPIDVTSSTTASHCGVCDGTATVDITGGSGLFTVTWAGIGGPAGTGTTVSGLCAGPYVATITDATTGCTQNKLVLVQDVGAETIVVNDGQTTCGNTCDGTVSVSFNCGSVPCVTTWYSTSGTMLGHQATLTGLCTGNYVVQVVNGNGCTAFGLAHVGPSQMILPGLTAVPASCHNSCDGSATVAPTGGILPYTYTWSPGTINGQGTPHATDLCPGTYQVLIQDASGCDTTVQVVINAPQPISVDALVQQVNCAGGDDGSIVLVPTGGAGFYSYFWTPEPPNGQGNNAATGLAAGNWTVTVSDLNGCDTTITYAITEPDPLTATTAATPSTCGACDGTASVNPAGGTGPYTITWSMNGTAIGTGPNISGLCSGLYAVQVVDANGCTVDLAVPIGDADGVALTVTDFHLACPGDCNGVVSVAFNCVDPPCTVAWFDAAGNDLNETGNTLTNLCEGFYLVQVTNGLGCTSVDTAYVTAPDPIQANLGTTPETCPGSCDGTATVGPSGGAGGYAYAWDIGGTTFTDPQVTGLCAGSYSVVITDAAGCSISQNALILSPQPFTVDAVLTDPACNGACDGSIVLDVQGGTGNLTFQWAPEPGAGQGTATATMLCADTYSVTITDANGCDTTLSFTIAEPDAIGITGTTTPGHCSVCDGTASVAVAGGTGALSVEWTDANGPVGTGTALSSLCAGVYVATVTDQEGCSASQAFAVLDVGAEDIQVNDGQVLCSTSCDGEVSVAYTCTDAPCTTTWYDVGGNVLGTQDTLPGLCPGTYIVQVLNGSGCLAFDTAQVVPSQVIVPNLGTTPPSCHDACDGTATVGPTGGTAPYTFAWSPEPGGGQGTPQATGLCAGTYQVLIQDALGCDIVVPVLITAPLPIDLDVQLQQISCAGAADGSIILAPTGGAGVFSYNWTPEPPNGQGNHEAINLGPGTWTVTVTDLNGCDTTATFDITGPDPLTATTSSTLSACAVCNGTATVSPAGGTMPYVITWTHNGAVVSNDETATNLCAGLYSVRVEDAHGCAVEMMVAVQDAGGETLATTDFMLTCPGNCDGVVSVAYNCDDPPCTTAWFDAAGNDLNEPGNTLTDLCAGTYLVQVTNGSGCVSIDTALVAAPDPIEANLGTTPETCPGSCDGTATVGPSGGAGGYAIAWDINGTTITDPQVTGLCAGSYTVTITDAQGCSIVQDALILSPPSITAIAVVGPITCNGSCDASIFVDAQGGTGTLTFHWTPEPPNGQGTNTVTGLCAGAWSVAIADANGCDTTFTLTITEPPVLTVDLSHTDNACFNDCVSTAHLDIAGGVAPYAITWTDQDGNVIDQNVEDVFGLCAGSFEAAVTDARGCTVIQGFTVGSGDPIEANLAFLGESCNGPCDGTATVAPTGGSGSGYTMLWQPDNPIGQGTNQVSGLCPGLYSVLITDGLGCDTTYSFTIDPYQPIDANAVVQMVSCHDACDGSITLQPTGGAGALTFLWQPEPGSGQGTDAATGLCAGTWSVTITDAAGCDTTITWTITEPPALVFTVDSLVDATCNSAPDGSIAISISGGTPGYTVQWDGPGGFQSTDEDIAGLLPGTYTVLVTDVGGCQLTSTVEVGSLSTVNAVAGADQQVCAGSAVVLDGSATTGASGYQWTDGTGTPVGSGPVLDLGALPEGTYTFALLAFNGPCTDTDTVEVTVLPLPEADAGPGRALYIGGNTVLGGSPTGPAGSTFQWLPDSLLDHHDVPNPTATVNQTTWFYLTVTAPNGCVGVDSVLVTVVPEVKVPSGFTPNGDGYNDTWVLDFVSLFPELEVQVFSRWGEPLFRSVGYTVPWDGKYDGKPVPVGTYYYVIDLHDERFPEALTGPLTVIR